MADGVNKVILIGNLGADPETNQTQNGDFVMNMRLAVGESYLDKNTGQKVEKTEWVNLVMWGNRASALAPHLTKGTKSYIEGKLQTRMWEDKQGNKRYSTEVNLKDLQFLGGRQEAGHMPPSTPQPDPDDDIPF